MTNMLDKLGGLAASLLMTALTGLFTYMTVLTGGTPLPNGPAAAMQVFSFVILLGAAIAAAALAQKLWRETWNLFRSPKSPD